MWSPDTYTFWQGEPQEGATEHTIQLANPAGEVVDYLGLVGHNLDAAGVVIHLEHSFDGGGTWEPTTPPVSPSRQAAIMIHFDPISAHNLRLRITSNGAFNYRPRIAHLRLGPVLRLQRKMYVGISPFTHNKRVDKIVTVSDNGKYLGSRARSTINLYTIRQPDNTAAFIRTHITPFLDHAELIGQTDNAGPSGTFFAAWRPWEYPDEVLYCHPPEQIERPSNQRPNGMVQWSISGEAEA